MNKQIYSIHTWLVFSSFWFLSLSLSFPTEACLKKWWLNSRGWLFFGTHWRPCGTSCLWQDPEIWCRYSIYTLCVIFIFLDNITLYIIPYIFKTVHLMCVCRSSLVSINIQKGALEWRLICRLTGLALALIYGIMWHEVFHLARTIWTRPARALSCH